MEITLPLRQSLGFVLGLLAMALPLSATDILRSPQDLKELDLEELLATKVISVSRTLQDWTTAPAAIDLLSSEDIRRSGAVRLADVLRIAPGLDVARYVGSSYAVTARGFSSSSVNKMQVLFDGRSLYTPLFSGVFWEIQDTLLEDLDRIEVVRGPGATMWGANAVNGVINIVSKNARDTQGVLISGGGGTEERAFGGVRYGGKAGESTFYRAYFKHMDRDDQVVATGASAHDGMSQSQGGFRLDTTPAGGGNLFTLQGDLYFNAFGIAGRPDAKNEGGNLLARWTHDFSDGAELQTQFYYDRGYRNVPRQFLEDRETYDLDIQHHRKIGDRQDLVVGGNYRTSSDATGTSGTFVFAPVRRTLELVSGFVQDEIAFNPRHLTLYLGSKFEHNDFTGFEVQPSARLAFTPDPQQTLWGGISRAVRSPTRVDTDSRFIPVPASGAVFIQGDPDFRSEDLVSYELGYRIQPHPRLFLDFALFYNVYDHLRTLEPSLPFGLPLVIKNERDGETSGAELNATFQPIDWWRLVANYSYLHEDLRFFAGSRDPTGGSLEANDPRHHGSLRSSMTLPGAVEFDWTVRYASPLHNPATPGYVAVDVRLAFHPTKKLELALIGQNISDPEHPEFGGGAANQPEVQRGYYGQLTWRF